MRIHCEECKSEWPRTRDYFPWGSKKPKICRACIDARFYHMLVALGIDEDAIAESVNGNK